MIPTLHWILDCRSLLAVLAILLTATVCVGCDRSESEDPFNQAFQRLLRDNPIPLRTRPAISPDGDRLLYASSEDSTQQLVELDITQLPAPILTRRDIPVAFPFYSLSADGICLSQIGEGTFQANIGLVSDVDARVELLTKSTVLDTFPSFSADGRLVLFARAEKLAKDALGGDIWWDWDIWCVDRSGIETRLTENHFARIDPPYFSPDGTRAIFAAEEYSRESTHRIRILSLSDSPNVQETTIVEPLPSNAHKHGVWDANPQFSPSGDEVVFVSDQSKPFRYELWMLNLADMSRRQITKENGRLYYPVLAPDENLIYYLRENADDTYDICRIKRDGSSPEVLKRKLHVK